MAQATERFKVKSKELQLYKSEVKKAIAGTSSFDMELLNELIAESKEQIDTAQADMENAQAEIDGYEQLSTMIEARYGCHYKVRHPQLCDGQSGYGVTKLDAIVEQIIKNLFERIKTTPKEEMLHTQYENHLRLGKTALAQATERHRTKSKELQLYKSEVKKVIAGTSSFDMELLNELIAETKEHIDAAQADIENAQAEIDGYEQISTMIEARYDNITTWADLFDYSTIESKKMIIAQLIKQIRIGRDYEMEIDLNVKYEMFSGMLQEDQLEEKNDMKESA